MKVWVIGCGKFGSRTVSGLVGQHPDISITVVDSDPDRLRPWEEKAETIQCDGVEFVARHLKEDSRVDWIIPAIPVHLTYEWLMRTSTDVHLEPAVLPKGVAVHLPNPIWGKNGELYASHADFLCPEDCPEPPLRCTVTGKERIGDMYAIFEMLLFPNFNTVIIRSHQMFPGAGGYQPRALFQVRDAIHRMAGNALVGTACRCHGVLHGVSIR
ncbi:MAG: hypothetical protein A2V65_07000 [Deltaproteobacteria bacterium RBG_13_49_15]|nr:MAG: hypothetical protein A2V65_07000 [Deltaproteobacteria bacterium RBG_13_49_15]